MSDCHYCDEMERDCGGHDVQVITPGVVLAVRQPVPLSRISRYLRGWSKKAKTEVRGDFLVVIEPEDQP